MPLEAAAGGKPISVGDRLYFLGYSDDVPYEILGRGQMVVVVEVRADGEYGVFPIDDWGRVVPPEGETVFAEEVLLVPLPPIPKHRLTPPFGPGA